MARARGSKAPKWLFLCVIVWLPASLAAIYVLNDYHLTPFMHPNANVRFYDEVEVTEIIVPWLNQRIYKQQTAIHFYRSSCHCNYLVNRHLDELDKNKKVNLKKLDLDKVNLPFTLPATPALLIVGSDNLPKYFGAYGFGQFCLPIGNSIWAQLIEQPNQPSIFLNTMGKGCFCNETIVQNTL